jgi:hypothetical protein
MGGIVSMPNRRNSLVFKVGISRIWRKNIKIKIDINHIRRNQIIKAVFKREIVILMLNFMNRHKDKH